MNSSIVKHQHYVCREYLRSWTNSKDQIWCILDGKKPYLTNIMNVAQGNYFYQATKPFSLAEKLFLYKMAEKISEEKINKFQKSMIDHYSDALNTYQDILIGSSNKEVKNQANKIMKQAEESVQTSIESFGLKYLDIIKQKNLDFLNDSDNKAKFLYFVAEQHVRTKKIRDELRFLADSSIDIANIINPLTHIFAQQISLLISVSSNKYHIILLENNSKIPFITGDQPVINTLSKHTDITKGSINLEYYYPVSPDVAILITNNKKYCENLVEHIGESDVKNYNQMIKMKHHKFLFAKNESDFSLI